jgi:hypothetical protein
MRFPASAARAAIIANIPYSGMDDVSSERSFLRTSSGSDQVIILLRVKYKQPEVNLPAF